MLKLHGMIAFADLQRAREAVDQPAGFHDFQRNAGRAIPDRLLPEFEILAMRLRIAEDTGDGLGSTPRAIETLEIGADRLRHEAIACILRGHVRENVEIDAGERPVARHGRFSY